MAISCDGDTNTGCKPGQICSTFVTGAGGPGICQGGSLSADMGREREGRRGIDPTDPRWKDRRYSRFTGSTWFSGVPTNDRLWFNASADGVREDEVKEERTTEEPRPVTPQDLGDEMREMPTPVDNTSVIEPKSRTQDTQDTNRGREIRIRGNFNDMESFIRQANAQGKMIGVSPEQAKNSFMKVIMDGTEGGTNPAARKWWQCGKGCSFHKVKTGKCVGGGCLMIGGWPPSEFEISWDI